MALPWWLAVLVPPLAALLILALTFLYWDSEHRRAQEQRVEQFQVVADRFASTLLDRLSTYEIVLRGIKGYFEGSERIEREEFQSYVEALQLPESRPGLQGVSLLLYLPEVAIAAHVADMRKSGLPDYAVRPPGSRPHYGPITHIEPMAGDNLRVMGFDALTIPAARAAMERAADTGQLALTAPMPLLQHTEPNAPPGMVMYQPLYRAGSSPRSVAERQAKLQGWVSAPFRLADVLAGMADEIDSDIRLSVVDVTTPSARLPVYSTPARGGAEPARGTHSTERSLTFGGRSWQLQIASLPAYDLRNPVGSHHLLAVGGVVLSLLLGWSTWLLVTGRERALTLARGMTAALRATHDDLESTLNAIPDLLFELDAQGVIRHARTGRSELQALAPEHFTGRALEDVVSPDAAAGCRAALQAAARTGFSSGHQYRLDLNGASLWFELSIARKDDSAAPRFIALSRDITERKRAEARSHQLAYFDGLTGLPNRRMLIDRLEHALAAARHDGEPGALLYVDLDNFKQINDARGHSIGDLLLQQVAERLGRLARPGDTVARISGDEFVVLARNIAADMDYAGHSALSMAQALSAALAQPYVIDQTPYSATGSIGITLFPKCDEGVDDLLREADTAMYRAKDLGRNRIRFFEAAMQADVQERLALEQDLKRAHERGELAAFVQPQVDARGMLVGGELLMRWNHPERGQVSPVQFIPVAESSGLIVDLGDWMIRQACEALVQLAPVHPALALSVNVSVRQFRQEDFVERVRSALTATSARPDRLILEVTEGLLIEHLDDTIARMTELVALGVRFSIDDFGTGYSSLAYLKRLPLYELKIDRSFVKDTPEDPNDTAIVESILSVARHLKLRVVAEGVETQAQAEFLTRSRCDCLQGYLYGRPEPLVGWLNRVAPRR